MEWWTHGAAERVPAARAAGTVSGGSRTQHSAAPTAPTAPTVPTGQKVSVRHSSGFATSPGSVTYSSHGAPVGATPFTGGQGESWEGSAPARGVLVYHATLHPTPRA